MISYQPKKFTVCITNAENASVDQAACSSISMSRFREELPEIEILDFAVDAYGLVLHTRTMKDSETVCRFIEELERKREEQRRACQDKE